MKSFQKTSIVCTALFIVFTSCNNSTSETSQTKTDTVITQHSNSVNDSVPNSSQMDNMPMNGGLMSSMNATMEKMKNMKMSGDFDMDWAYMMIAHHQGAIDMAQHELSQGKDEQMKSKAQEIITKQKEEIKKLRAIADHLKPSSMKMGEGELQKSMSEMMDKMKGMQMSGNVDKDFATMMSAHHEEGISMAKMELNNGMSDKLKQMAQKSIIEQQKDIAEFKTWLNTHK